MKNQERSYGRPRPGNNRNPQKAQCEQLAGHCTSDILKHAETCMKLSDVPKTLEYMRTKNTVRTNVHVGQIKLFLGELEFMTSVLTSHTDEAIFIYAGSAPSNKLPYLAKLFPNCKFVLVDPNEHYLQYGKRDQYNEAYRKDMLYFVAGKHNGTGPGYQMRKSSHVSPKLLNMYSESGSSLTMRRENLHGSIPDNISQIILETKYRYYVIEDLFTDNLAELLKPLTEKNTYFLSDIRTNTSENKDLLTEVHDGTREDSDPTNLDILWNSAMMYNWINILKPKSYMIKLRCPYDMSESFVKTLLIDYDKHPFTHNTFAKCPIPFIDNFTKGKFEFLNGEIWLQAFAGCTSTESRLVGNDINVKTYDVVDYNNRFFYYNRIHRAYGFHNVIVSPGTRETDTELGIDHCGDCAIMCQIFSNYLTLSNGDVSSEHLTEARGSFILVNEDEHRTHNKMVGELLTMVNRNLKDNAYGIEHGLYLRPFESVAQVVAVQSDFIQLYAAKNLTKYKALKSYEIITNYLARKQKSNIELHGLLQIIDTFGSDAFIKVVSMIHPQFRSSELRDVIRITAQPLPMRDEALPTDVQKMIDDLTSGSSYIGVSTTPISAFYNVYNFLSSPQWTGNVIIVYMPNTALVLQYAIIQKLKASSHKIIAITDNRSAKTYYFSGPTCGNYISKII